MFNQRSDSSSKGKLATKVEDKSEEEDESEEENSEEEIKKPAKKQVGAPSISVVLYLVTKTTYFEK